MSDLIEELKRAEQGMQAGALTLDALDAATMSEARALAAHVESLDPPGRVLLAASYDDPALPVPFAVSQASGAPLMEAGVPVVGAYYSSLPMRTRGWTSALAGRDGPGELMGVTIDGPAAIDALLPGLEAAAVSDVVVHEPAMIAAFAARADFLATGRSGRHATFRRREAPSWGSGAAVRRLEPLDFEVTLSSPGDVSLALAFQPSLVSSSGTLEQASDGRIRVTGLPSGTHRITLSRREPWPPWAVSLGTLVVALAWLLARRAS